MKKQEDVIKIVQLGETKVTLMGTAHVSQLSVDMVEEHIQRR